MEIILKQQYLFRLILNKYQDVRKENRVNAKSYNKSHTISKTQ